MTPLGRYVVETAVTLAAIIAVAILIVYAARRAGLGKAGGPLELLGRLPLDGRRSVCLVRVGTTVYILGTSEAGLTKIGEIPDHELKSQPGEIAHGPFREVLQRTLRKKTQTPAPPFDSGVDPSA